MPIADNSNRNSPESDCASELLHYAVTHIFFPVHPADEVKYTWEKDLSLVRAACAAAHAYSTHVPRTSELQWNSITRMLDNLQESLQSVPLESERVLSQLRGMRPGDTLAFFVQPHNSAIVLTKWESCMLFESFEVSPCETVIESTAGSLTCAYPGFAFEIPNQAFDQVKLANFLCRPSTVDSDPPLASAHVEYVTALSSDIFQGVCRAHVPRIVKRIRDDVRRSHNWSTGLAWRRSSLWLLVRVAIQMSIDRSSAGREIYKAFMLSLVCAIANDENVTTLSSELLHLMASKILQRSRKLNSIIPDWLSQMVLKTCAGLQEVLNARRTLLNTRSPLFRNPSQDELARDTILSSLYIPTHEYTLDDKGNNSDGFRSSHNRRRTLSDFLSSNDDIFNDMYSEVTQRAVERAVEQEIDEWAASVTSLDDACTQLEILMDQYMEVAAREHPEEISIYLLTSVELFIALDKLVAEEIPTFSDYSPEIPISFLEKLLFRKAVSLHRLARVYQYLSVRHSRSHPGWSLLSEEFTENSFSVRYYDQSVHLQRLKARIEQDAMAKGTYQSSLPTSPLHAKVVVFELHCPSCIRIWRSAVARILQYLDPHFFPPHHRTHGGLLAYNAVLQPYLITHGVPSLHVQLCFAYSDSGQQSHFQNNRALCYVLRCSARHRKRNYRRRNHLNRRLSSMLHNSLYFCTRLVDYVISTSHTPNGVLSTQEYCPIDLSPDEFIAFGQLRSGGLLQWPNILRGLRSRTLNFRHPCFHYLLSWAALQVGPLDLNTGLWIWHQELQDCTFCDALLDELESLFIEVGAGSIDATTMGIISLLLTRMLASSPHEDISARIIVFLRSVRKKTFSWVQELSYNLAKAPMNKERRTLLLGMAATCRSTLDVDSAILPKLFHSAEDIDASISSYLLIYVLRSESYGNKYLCMLLLRDGHISFILEDILRDVILMDVSDYGIDLAVRKLVPSHKAGVNRWQPMEHPNPHWLTCKTKEDINQPSQTVHLDLLGGKLRVDGQHWGGLPGVIERSQTYQEIFRDQGFFVIPSNIPGMGFTTLSATSGYKVHFSSRGYFNLTIRVQCTWSSDILELIPPSELSGLPPALIEGHVHWLNLSTRIIEIRPLERLWEQSAENWRIDCAYGRYRAYKGHEALVDIQSSTWTMASQCFKCLNISGTQDNNLIVSASRVECHQSAPSLRLSVTLPHYGLSFSVNPWGELESNDFKDMVYDENRCIGALLGLENMLVLRQRAHFVDGLMSRRVLIPNGFPKKHADSNQVRVETGQAELPLPGPSFYHAFDVETGQVAFPISGQPVYYTYSVDVELGCLTGDSSLTSERYLAYLHVMTSCDSPDPLTGKTGAQAALCLLRSASCRSIMKSKALDDDTYWTSTRYPQINSSHNEIRKRYYWDRRPFIDKAVIASEKRAVQRAAYLFHWHVTGPTFPEDCNHEGGDCLISGNPAEPAIAISNEHKSWQVTLEWLLSDRSAPPLPHRSALFYDSYKQTSSSIADSHRLFSSLSAHKSTSPFQQEYIALLEKSAQHAREESGTTRSLIGEDHVATLEQYYVQCRTNYFHALGILKKRLGPTADPYQQMLDRFGQWPSVTAGALLRCLASTSSISVPGHWKKCLTSLALLLLDLQRARRLLRLVLEGPEEDFQKELENEGCDGWVPEDHPDWLLIQIQGNFLIRRVQAEVTTELMSPKNGRNTVTQINMGEGKSSVIIPLAAAALADGKQLIRVIVPRALTTQMFEFLVTRLGGLADRPVYYLPFSRTAEDNHDDKAINLQIDGLRELMSRCVAERGILLVQPEHVVSLKMKIIEKQIYRGKYKVNIPQHLKSTMYKHIETALLLKSLPRDSYVGSMFQLLTQSKPTERACDAVESASKWLDLHEWIESHIRDIMDESDEILHPRFQLIYTVGLQKHLDGYPGRWVITQQILRLVKVCLRTLAGNSPNAIEYDCGPPGSFPQVGIVRSSDVGGRLISLVVEHVMAGQLPGFNFQDIPSKLRDAIRSFISDKDVLQNTANRVEEYTKHSDKDWMWSGLMLLRGLLASHRTLLFALTERRWRVDYGLASVSHSQSYPKGSPAPASSMLAVPYRAKDMPAPYTHFGHPDMSILLTCLSYYYGGLSEEQLRATFEMLLDCDDPSTEYTLWIKDYDDGSLPDWLRTLGEINLRSSEQWDKVIFPLFSRNQAAIDLYLSQTVFPQEAKDYPWKLSASSWDIAEQREKVITGLSGTNDGRWLLPMSINQYDFDHQQGTNARILAYLLQPENDVYLATQKLNARESTHEFLQMIATQQPEVRVLLDVGAQILGSSNLQLSEKWLDVVHDAAGAIYFNEEDELTVLNRNGTTQSLSSSPFSQRLDRCLVYLDHAHTMGTDIKLPIGSRAAVTLGPKLTRDRLVQGCMRMRKLGHGHSVLFFASPDVDLSIRALIAKTDPRARVTTVDILCWAIHETWADIQHRAPHWAQQGTSHKSRSDAWSRFCNGNSTKEELSDAWLQPELKSLEELYAPCKTGNDDSTDLSALDPEIQQRCKDLGILSLPSGQMEEEQEREVNREWEREREVELPPKAEPVDHSLHPAVVTFVKTGIIPPLHSDSAFHPIFTTLDSSSAATQEADVWSSSILATTDFCSTIKPESTQGTMDQYLRPVQWVLSNQRGSDQVLVLLSPFEADRLLPDIRDSEYVHLHLYAPRTSQRMKPSDDLKLYSIPPLPSNWTPPWALIDQLNVFAGQLYLRDYRSYLRLCRFFEFPTSDTSPNDTAVRRNLYHIPGSLEQNEITFSGSPLPSVMALLAIRNRGRPFAQTHMGRILQGQALSEKDFDEPQKATPLPVENVPASESATPPQSRNDPGPSIPSLSSSKRRLTEKLTSVVKRARLL